jgi:hypothetical protein
MAGIEPKTCRNLDSSCGVTQDVRRQVGDATAGRALGVQMLDMRVLSRHRHRLVNQVVRSEPAIEVDVAKQPSTGKAFKGSVDGGPVNGGFDVGDLIVKCIGGQVITPGGEDLGEECHPWLRDALTHRTEQLSCLLGEIGLRTCDCHHDQSAPVRRSAPDLPGHTGSDGTLGRSRSRDQ